MNILQIQVQNTFKHKNTIVKFKDGVNLLRDKNEGGKSLLLSMICYALYGTTALRGDSSDFKDLKVNMIFKIDKTTYIVDRAKKDQLFKLEFDENNDLQPKAVASGKAVVNEYIVKLLGYKLDTFYKINFSQQLEGDAYATSKKSERLDLINKINGIDEATALEKYIEAKKKALKSEIKGLDMSAVINNISFTPNPDLDQYDESRLQFYSDSINKKYESITTSESMLQAYNMIPKKPAKSYQDVVFINPFHNTTVDVDTYITLYATHSKNISELLKKQKIKMDYLSKHAIYTDKQVFISEEEVKELERIAENNKLFEQKQTLLSQGDITCPHCQKSFPLMYQSLTSLEDVKFIPILYNPNYPKIARNFLEVHLQLCVEYSNELKDIDKELEQLQNVKWDINLSDAESYKTTEQRYKDFVKQYEASYNKFLNTYNTIDIDPVGVELEISNLKAEIASLSQARSTLEQYLRSKSVYISSQLAKKEVENVVNANKKKIEAYDTLLAESKAYKLSVQNKCIPMLNKKASTLVHKMTGGEHYSLTLSDTFELTLDSKPLSIYSGSTQVLANVAFRIALIEMYFKNTFPVFIGDEIDAFADPERAQHMHNAIEKLSKEGYQIILISHHKDLDNENFNIIELAKCKNK